MTLYEIFRSFAPHHPTRPNETKRRIRTGLTLDEAQEHCRDESTHGSDWFDGYRKVQEEEEEED